jgi:PAS domain S-box-containing protein
MSTPTVPLPDPPSVEDSLLPSGHGLGLRQEVLDESSLAIVEVDMQRRIRYANPAALRLLGAPANYLGLCLDLVFVDEASKKRVDKEIERRRAGFIGNYRVIARRLSDGHQIPLQITGFPISDERGEVVIGLGLLRSLEQQELTEAIRQLNRPGSESRRTAQRACSNFAARDSVRAHVHLPHEQRHESRQAVLLVNGARPYASLQALVGAHGRHETVVCHGLEHHS